MKVCLVYDRVNKWGGAERVLLALHEIWPKAPLFTSVYNPQTASWAQRFKVVPSFLNRLPCLRTRHQLIPFLMPLAFESFNFDEFDVVISVTSEFAKGIITKPQTLHLCYCLTPTRYLWSGYEDYFSSSALKFFSSPVVSYLRNWDQIAAQRVDEYLAISKEVKRRIKQYYGRPSSVLYPPVDTVFFKPAQKEKKGKYFLIVSRLVPYKRVNLAIDAFNQLGWPLKIIGDGIARHSLEKLAKKNIEFLGQQLTEQGLLNYYQNCRALVFCGQEDLGLVSLEAQACGKPVIAYQGGGLPETIIEGQTGEFFSPQTSQALTKTLLKFTETSYNTDICHQQAKKSDDKIFKKKFKEIVEERWQQHEKN